MPLHGEQPGAADRAVMRSSMLARAALLLAWSAGSADVVAQCEPSFSLVPAVPPAGTSLLESVYVEDIDGDLDLDVWLQTFGAAHVAWNPGHGALLPAAPAGSFPYLYWSIELAHVNDDRRVDLVVTDDFTPPLGQSNGSWVGIYRGIGDGQFDFAGAVVVPQFANETIVDDMDGDGTRDLFSTYGDLSPGGVAVTFGHSDGTWEQPLVVSTGWTELDDAAVTDFDADGLLDAVALKSSLWIVRQPTARQFIATVFELGSSKSQAIAGDLDGDGLGDIGCKDGFGAAATLRTFLSLGAGGFGQPVISQPGLTGSGYWHYPELELVDVDLDGTLDLAGQLAASLGTLAWARGTGDGSFEAATAFSTAGVAKLLRYGDLDRDADVDAVSADDVPAHLGSWINHLADWKTIGGGVAGAEFRLPELHILGPPCEGGSVSFEISHAAHAALGAVWLGLPLPDGTPFVNGLLAAPRVLLATFLTDASGTATTQVSWPILAGVHGRRILVQAQVQDAAVHGGISASAVVAHQID